MSRTVSTNAKKKLTKVQKVLLIVLISILGLLLAAAIALYAVFSHYYNKMDYAPLEDHTEPIFSVSDETDPPLTETVIRTETVTDEKGNQLPPVTHVDTVTVQPPVTENPTLEQKENEKIDKNVNSGSMIKVGKNVKNILLIGTDGRTVDDRGRSDSMILVTINENTKKITMTSFMRDMYVYIPKVNAYNRINAAYASGGVPLLIDTIEANFKLEIDQYVRVNFQSFEYIVDTLGGVDIKLSQAEIDFLGLTGKAEPGTVHLNGEQALKYCRCRQVKKGNLSYDFARTARQREFLEIMSQKLRGLSVSQLTELLDVFLPYVTTNLKQSDMLSLIVNCASYLNYDIESKSLPVSGSWENASIRKMSVLVLDFKKNIKELEKIVGN